MNFKKIIFALLLYFMFTSCDAIIGTGGNKPDLPVTENGDSSQPSDPAVPSDPTDGSKSDDSTSPEPPATEPVLTSISAKMLDGKAMLVGKEFAKDKVLVSANYDDGSSKNIGSDEWKYEGSFDSKNTTTAQTVKIVYKDKEAELTVTVSEYKKFVVVAVAGQSNAVGYDESELDSEDVAKDLYRVMELSGGVNPAITPLDYCAHNMQDMRSAVSKGLVKDGVAKTYAGTKGIHLPLANLLLESIPEDYGVLVIPVAFGGTALVASGSGNSSTMWCSNGQQWGPNTNYSYTLQNRIKWALSENAQNKFAGIIWCQGESNDKSPDALKTGFPAMVKQVNDFLTAEGFASCTKKGSIDNSLWFIYESTDAYMRKGVYANGATFTKLPDVSAIWAWYKQWNPSNYVELPAGIPLNTTHYTSSTAEAHFGQNAFRTHIAPAVVAKMKSAGVL